MPYKNPKDLLIDATKFPVAIEAKLPAGAPKISTMLADAAARIPAIPDLPVEIPNLPAPPELPAAPAALATVFAGPPLSTPVRREIIPSPAVGLIPEVITRRGI